MPYLDYSTAFRGAQDWIFTARSSITATKITASVGSSTSDLQLGHKTYHRVDFQLIYTMPPESSSSDTPHTGKWFGSFFHVPLVLLQSSHHCHYQNLLSPIYIIRKESASSNSPRTLTCRKRILHVVYAPHTLHTPPPLLLLTSSVMSLCHVSPSWCHLPIVIDVICWHHLFFCWYHCPVSLLMSYVDLPPLTVDFRCWLLILTRFDGWLLLELTFVVQVFLAQFFRIDFVFAIRFCIFCF